MPKWNIISSNRNDYFQKYKTIFYEAVQKKKLFPFIVNLSLCSYYAKKKKHYGASSKHWNGSTGSLSSPTPRNIYKENETTVLKRHT